MPEDRSKERMSESAKTTKSSTREALVETAARLFHERGYHATGIAAILREAGANSGSLYHFFANKEDLLAAVLERYLEKLEPYLMAPVERAEEEPIARIFLLLAGYRERLFARRYAMGCPIGNLALEVGDESERIRNLIDRNFADWQAALASWLEGEGVQPETARDMALFTLTTMEGGIMLSRAQRSLEPFDSAMRMLRDYFERLLDRPR